MITLPPLRKHSLGITVFDLADISDQNIADWDLDDLSGSYCGETVLVLDLRLEPSELFLLPPIVEGRHQNDDDDRTEDSNALDPTGFRFRFVNGAWRPIHKRS